MQLAVFMKINQYLHYLINNEDREAFMLCGFFIYSSKPLNLRKNISEKGVCVEAEFLLKRGIPKAHNDVDSTAQNI